MKVSTCYKCGKEATGKEHIPPLCVFPEQKDLGEDFRKNRITVPSCDEHNLKKSKDDEYLMACITGVVGNNSIGYKQTTTKVRRTLDQKHPGFLEKIIRNAKETEIITESGKVFPVLVGALDSDRLHKCIEQIASGLYFHEFKERFKGETRIVFGFINYENLNTNKFKIYLKDIFNNETDRYRLIGHNPKIFYYQVIPKDQHGLTTFRLTFFEGTDFFISLKDEMAPEPFDLGMKLIQDGIKSTIKYNGKDYDFN